jgi:pimeloyl-ACP methyl ester carboxylesterase
MQTPSKDGTAIAFTRSGAGPPLVLVHGTSADRTRWAPISAPLERHFTVHAVDRRGRGDSGDSPGGYAIHHEFDDVAAVMDAIGEPAVLLGHSYGAICSLEAAVRTALVRKLVLYEPPVPAGLPIYPPGVADRLEALAGRGDGAGVVTSFFTEVVRMPAHELAMLQSLPSWGARVSAAHTIPREMRASEQYRFDPARFRTLSAPVLLLLGGDSPPFFRAAIDLVHAALPSSRVRVLPGQQHVAINTAPELFLKEVLAFALD